MILMRSLRTLCFFGSAIALTSVTACQLLLPDGPAETGGGGATASSSGSTGTATASSSGSGKTSSATGSPDVASATASSGGANCMLGSGTCSEATPNFPDCPNFAPTNCNGNADSACSAYCTSVKRCEQFGRPQYSSGEECCRLCASIVENTTDKSTLCCRADALNKAVLTKDACTKAGPFGTADDVDAGCGTEIGQLCALAFHACSNVPAQATCNIGACQLKLGGQTSFDYKSGDQSPDAAHAMTLALQALTETDPGNLTDICNTIYGLVCPG